MDICVLILSGQHCLTDSCWGKDLHPFNKLLFTRLSTFYSLYIVYFPSFLNKHVSSEHPIKPTKQYSSPHRNFWNTYEWTCDFSFCVSFSKVYIMWRPIQCCLNLVMYIEIVEENDLFTCGTYFFQFATAACISILCAGK